MQLLKSCNGAECFVIVYVRDLCESLSHQVSTIAAIWFQFKTHLDFTAFLLGRRSTNSHVPFLVSASISYWHTCVHSSAAADCMASVSQTLYFIAFNFLLWMSRDCGILHMMWTEVATFPHTVTPRKRKVPRRHPFSCQTCQYDTRTSVALSISECIVLK